MFGLAVWFGLVAILGSEPRRNHAALTQGELATYSIKAPRKIQFQSNIRTEAIRREAADSVEPVRRFDESISESSGTELINALNVLESVRSMDGVAAIRASLGVSGLDFAEGLRGTAPGDLSRLAASVVDDSKAFYWLSHAFGDFWTLATLVSRTPGIEITRDEAAALLLVSDDTWRQVRLTSLRITQSAMSGKITEAQIEEAHQAAMRQAFEDRGDQQFALVGSLSKGFIRANYVIDELATERARRAASENLEPVVVTIEAGETIVGDGELIRPEHLEKLKAAGLSGGGADRGELRARAALLAGMIAIFVGYLASYPQRRIQNAGPLVLLGLILLVAVGISKALPIENDLKPVFLPFAAGTMLVSVLLGTRLAFVTGVVSAFAISIAESNAFDMAPHLFIMGSVGVLAARQMESQSFRLLAVSSVGLCALATGLIFRYWGGDLELEFAMTILAGALINGVLSMVIVVKLTPGVSLMFGVTRSGQTLGTLVPGSRLVGMSESSIPDAGQAIPVPAPASVAGAQDTVAAIAREQATLVSPTTPDGTSEEKPNEREGDAAPPSPAPPEEGRATAPTALNINPEFEDFSQEYYTALLATVIGTLVAHADGTVSKTERERLKIHIDGLTELSASERVRLHDNLNWMIDVPPDVGLIAKRCERLSSEQKRWLGRRAIVVAGIDGKINPPEVVAVRNLYRAMGLSDGVFFDDLRELLTGPATTPAAISPPRQHDPGRPVHEPLQSARPPRSAVVLDPKRLAETKADTQQVSIILGEIFAPEDFQEATERVDSTSDKYEGLDRSYEAMVDELLRRSTWSRRDFDELAKRFNLMADGAVEELNEWAYTRFGEALVEEDMDRLVVNLEIIEEDAG